MHHKVMNRAGSFDDHCVSSVEKQLQVRKQVGRDFEFLTLSFSSYFSSAECMMRIWQRYDSWASWPSMRTSGRGKCTERRRAPVPSSVSYQASYTFSLFGCRLKCGQTKKKNNSTGGRSIKTSSRKSGKIVMDIFVSLPVNFRNGKCYYFSSPPPVWTVWCALLTPFFPSNISPSAERFFLLQRIFVYFVSSKKKSSWKRGRSFWLSYPSFWNILLCDFCLARAFMDPGVCWCKLLVFLVIIFWILFELIIMQILPLLQLSFPTLAPSNYIISLHKNHNVIWLLLQRLVRPTSFIPDWLSKGRRTERSGMHVEFAVMLVSDLFTTGCFMQATLDTITLQGNLLTKLQMLNLFFLLPITKPGWRCFSKSGKVLAITNSVTFPLSQNGIMACHAHLGGT